MNCKVGDVVTIVRSTPKLLESWKKIKHFGVGSKVRVDSIQGEEVTVIIKSLFRSEKVTVPMLCLSCYTTPPPLSNAVWDGTNKKLRFLPEEDEQGVFLPEPTPEMEISAPDMHVPIPGQRICNVCGASLSESDATCNVCGTMMPSVEAELGLLDEPKAEEIPGKGGRTCLSCGAFVEDGATECLVCETPLEVVEKIQAETPKPEPTEHGNICPSCGAVVGPDATECPICETPFKAAEKVQVGTTKVAAVPAEMEETEPAPKEPEQPEPKKPETICAGCGAVLDEGTDECFVCGARVGEEPAATPAAAPEMPPAEEELEMPETKEEPAPEIHEIKEEPEPEIPPEEKYLAAEPKPEIVCAGCGAVLDEGADECFICGAKVGEEPTEIPAAAPEMPAEEMPAAPEPETPVEVEKPAEEIILGENEIQCPSCSSVIPADSEKCPECWNDLSLYIKCPSCGKLTPAGEETCRECFTAIGVAEAGEKVEEELGIETPGAAEQVEITEELKMEMTTLEAEEEQGKECLVCGAIFGPEDQLCPICGIEYGVTVEEPEMPESTWDHMDVEVAPTVHICPNCGKNVTGLEATDREISEGKWFYRGLVAIFIGIFFTSFSIYARGVSVENESLGVQAPPTDVVLSLFGWILVILGFVFWYMSWRLHGQKLECPSCGIETDPQMAVCINCGTQLIEEEEPAPGEEEGVEEDLLPEPAEEMPPEVPEIMPDGTYQDVPPEGQPPEEPLPEEPSTELPPETEEPLEGEAEAATPAHYKHGEDIPLDQEQHKKCPGCGIFVELTDTVCPICDTPFAPAEPVVEPAAEPPVKDAEIQIPSEEEELAGLDLTQPEATIDSITVPKESGDQIECPSCGASLEPGTKSCPVCEYPLEQ